jgi:hypothetical protein
VAAAGAAAPSHRLPPQPAKHKGLPPHKHRGVDWAHVRAQFNCSQDAPWAA